MRILIVEDEAELCDTIAEGLELDGYAVDRCYPQRLHRKEHGCINAATTPSGVVGVAEWIGGDDRFRRR